MLNTKPSRYFQSKFFSSADFWTFHRPCGLSRPGAESFSNTHWLGRIFHCLEVPIAVEGAGPVVVVMEKGRPDNCLRMVFLGWMVVQSNQHKKNGYPKRAVWSRFQRKHGNWWYWIETWNDYFWNYIPGVLEFRIIHRIFRKLGMILKISPWILAVVDGNTRLPPVNVRLKLESLSVFSCLKIPVFGDRTIQMYGHFWVISSIMVI